MFIVCIKLCWKLGFLAVFAISDIRMLKDGFPKEYYVVIEALLIPVALVLANVLGIQAKPGKELTVFFNGLYWKFAATIVMFCINEAYT